jgi:hypothetical protein
MNMNKKFLALVLASLCSLTLLYGEESAEKNRVPIGERTRPQTKNIEKSVEQAKNIEEDTSDVHSAAFANNASSHAFSYTSHAGAYHSALAIYDATGTVMLEDESVWTLYWGDVYKVSNWLPTDLIVIKPHTSLFSSYRYELVNQNTGVKVLTNLYLGPVYGNPYTHWIAAIDYYNNVIYLEDGTIWSMSLFDSGIISEWVPNDTVIIGVTDGLLNPNFLLNVNLLTDAKGMVVN